VVTLPVLEPQFLNWPSAPVSGLFTPEFSVHAHQGLGLQRVEILLDDVLIYSGTSLPGEGETVIDSFNLSDGSHQLQLRAYDSQGKTAIKTATFDVKNSWEIATELQAPVDTVWFGNVDFTSIYKKSAGWSFVGERAADYLSDQNRMVRSTPEDQYIIWQTPFLQSYEITFYSKKEALPAEVELSVSADGEHWKQVAAQAQTQVTGSSESGWRRLMVTGKLTKDAGAQFFRILIRSTLPLTDIEIGAVKLRGWNK
jgi:hypothetical protein